MAFRNASSSKPSAWSGCVGQHDGVDLGVVDLAEPENTIGTYRSVSGDDGHVDDGLRRSVLTELRTPDDSGGPLRVANLAVKFLLELAMLASLAYAGWHLLHGPVRLVSTIGLPLVAIVVWGR